MVLTLLQYRHRGHRFLSTRQFALAEQDLSKAEKLIASSFDSNRDIDATTKSVFDYWEADGAPNQ